MMGHLGSRVSALLDGRMPEVEEERAWEHVHLCHPCRDAVEREGWVKTRLAQLGHEQSPSSHSLRESLLSPSFAQGVPMGLRAGDDARLPTPSTHSLRGRHLAALGGGALGMAVLGVIALGAAPANAPQIDRRGPVTSIVPPAASADTRPVPASSSTPTPTPAIASSVRVSGVREKIAP